MSILTFLIKAIDTIVPKNSHYLYLKSDFLYQDNIQALLDAIIINHIDNTNKCFCDGVGFDSYTETKNILKVKRHSVYALWCFFRSKYVFTDIGVNGLNTPVQKQFLINTWHGTSLKKIGYLMNDNNCDVLPPKASYVVGYSPFFTEVLSKAFGVSNDRVLITGEPRNDYLFTCDRTILENLHIDAKFKILIWMPTYRQNKYDDSIDGEEYEFGIPLLTSSNINELNNICSKKNIILIIKWHGMQIVDEIKNKKFSNIRFITSEDIHNTGKPLYNLVACCDGLITDYSSIYINYLILNRPICFAYDDMEQYISKRGFMFEDVKSIMPGYHAESFESLLRFIKDFSEGKDLYSSERVRVNKLLNAYSDNKNSFRLLKAVGLI